MDESNDPIVGIDLGTTNSVVAAVIDGAPEVLTERDGGMILPSVVGLDPEGKLITGEIARNQLAAFPERTQASVKRHMGTMEKLKLGDEAFTPPEISAMILRRLRDRASDRLGRPVTRAVITVPAFFDENQRQATREAGELAGLKVERIINEPTAATLVYHAGSDRLQHIVVYDFGGGTFDVSVVRMEAGVVEVLSSKGDTQLGGDDLDTLLSNDIADRFLTEHDVDLRRDPGTRWRLLRACERAKCQLSTEAIVEIAEEFIAERDGVPLNLKTSVRRDEYEELIAGLIDRTIECVDEALRDAKLKPSEIDDLVLVGGSTRTPMIQQRLREEFSLEPSRAVDPDLAVALGAAMQGAMLGGQSVGPVLVDVTGHTLGIEVAVGYGFDGPILEFSPIIHRNSPLPASHIQSYFKSHAEQTTASIKVYQGEHSDLSRNRKIAEFDVDVDAGGGEKNRIDVRFDLNLDGILHATAIQTATGKKQALRIDNALSQFRDEDRDDAKRRLGDMFEASDEGPGDETDRDPRHATASPEFGGPGSAAAGESLSAAASGETLDAAGWRRVDAADPADGVASTANPAATATRLLQRARRLSGSLNDDDAEEIRELGQRLEAAIADDDHEQIDSICHELDDVLFYVE